MFLLRDRSIPQGEKRETSTQNLQLCIAAEEVERSCISYIFHYLKHYPENQNKNLVWRYPVKRSYLHCYGIKCTWKEKETQVDVQLICI